MIVLNLALIIISTSELLYFLEPPEPFLLSVSYFPVCKIGIIILKCFVMYFETQRGKAEQATLCIFLKTSLWPKNTSVCLQEVTSYCVSPAHIVSLSSSKSVKHNWKNAQQMLPFTYLFFCSYTIHKCSCRKRFFAKLLLERLFFIQF